MDFRIDAETYIKKHLLTEKIIKSMEFDSIGDIALSVQNFGAYSLCSDIEFVIDSKEYPFLLAQCVRDNYIDWQNVEYITSKSHEMLWKSYCKKGQVLITMAGAYLGKSAVYDEDFVCSSNQAIAKVTLKANYNPYFVTTFLGSEYGQNQVNRLKTVTGQPNINMALIREILIPKLSKEFQNNISQVIKLAHSKLEQGKNLYQQAETELLEALGLGQASLPTAEPINYNIKNFSDSFLSAERIDAEYYQSKYQILEEAIRNYTGGFCKLRDLTFSYSSGFPFDSSNYSDEGCTLIRINNIKDGRLELDNAVKVSMVDALKSPKDIVKENDILISMSGTIGSSCKIQKNVEAIINQRILKITPHNYNFDVLPLYINSLAGKMQLERLGTGGVQTNLSTNDILGILVPILPQETQTRLASLVQESFAGRQESERLLALAKHAVEVAIEQGEAEAGKLLSL